MAEAARGTPPSAPLEVVAETEAAVRRRRPLLRFVALWVVPILVVVAGCALYLAGGRFVDTDNAYIKADRVLISPEVGGTVVAVTVRDNDRVEAGTELFRLDDAAYAIAVTEAEARLRQAAIDVESDKLAYTQALKEIELFEADIEFTHAQYRRQQELKEKNLGTVEDLDRTRHALDAAQKRVEVSREHASHLLTRLAGDPTLNAANHPNVQRAQAALDRARLDLGHTVLHAPFDGVVTNVPRRGDFIERGSPSLGLVADRNMWVEANFKETQLTHVLPGQAVVVRVDTYPDRSFRGRVQSIARATGAEFALLPPQNATGNWVKIVQRIPVKVELEEPAEDLRMGMSAVVEIDTHHTRTWRDLLPDW